VVTNTPSGTGFVQVAGGGRHSLALRSDGSIISWGRDSEAQVTNTPSGTGFVHVAGGFFYSLALRTDGSIVPWGSDAVGQVTNAPSGVGFTQVAAGEFHALAQSSSLPPVVAYCTAGTSASGCMASLSASGAASASASTGFDVIATGVEGAKDGLFFFGSNGRQASPWGNGTSLQCVVTPVKRGGLLTGTGTPGLCDGAFTQDLNARWCATCPRPLHNPGAGAIVQAQLWYRDPFNTSNQTTSLSDAIEFLVAP
jgi:hypothetical protein